MIAGVLALLLSGCLPDPPKVPDPQPPTPPPAPQTVAAPEIAFSLPSREGVSPAAKPTDAALSAAREKLLGIVEKHTGDPLDPWAIGHGLIVQGQGMKLSNGKLALPWLFEEYAEWRTVGSEDLVGFPAKRGDIRIEPHTDLMLKAFMEIELPLEAKFLVDGKPATVEQLYRHSLWKAFTEDGTTSFRNMNDTPWALQSLSTVAPDDLAWTAANGRPTSMDAFTDAVVADLNEKTGFMKTAMAKGEKVKKERQGIFAYTCGGQHLLQGSAYAVARGFGSDQSRQWVADEVPVLFWRLDIELEIYDTLIEENPTFARMLLAQRLKFLGHFLETSHKLAALGIYTPTPEQSAQLDRARDELVKTVETMAAAGYLDGLEEYKNSDDHRAQQLYLDIVGDSAHAIRGIDFSTGDAKIRY